MCGYLPYDKKFCSRRQSSFHKWLLDQSKELAKNASDNSKDIVWKIQDPVIGIS
jgi:hypothetical protein